MTFDYTILEEKMKQLSPEMQKVLTSVEISAKIKKIGDTYSLKLDQESVLFDHTAYVMLGLMPSTDFVKELAKDADIDIKTAELIAGEINTGVFGEMRAVMQEVENSKRDEIEQQEKAASSISDLEKIGNFTIDKPEREEAEEKTESLKTMSDETVTSTHREALLNALENPEPTPQLVMSTGDDVHTEPLVDLLMNKPTSIPEERVVKTSPAPTPVATPKVEPVKKVAPGPDPYREPLI
jgi:restriction endonuclease